MACHGTGILEGDVEFEDLSYGEQLSIRMWNHRPTPGYAVLAFYFHAAPPALEIAAGVVLLPATYGASSYLIVDGASGVAGALDFATEGAFARELGVDNVDFVGAAYDRAFGRTAGPVARMAVPVVFTIRIPTMARGSVGASALPRVPASLEALRGRVDYYGWRANRFAWERGLGGDGAGRLVDRYVAKAVFQLNRELVSANSPYRVYSQYGRDVFGREHFGWNHHPAQSFSTLR